jgi:hypothetical protein
VAQSLIYLLDDWRWERTDALAQAIDVRTTELLDGVALPAPAEDRDFHRAWIVATKDVVRRGWAAATLGERLTGARPGHRLGRWPAHRKCSSAEPIRGPATPSRA